VTAPPGRARRRRLRILFASAEFAPLAQTGGLGEAVGGLARALAARGHEVVCALPGWRRIRENAACPALADAGAAVGVEASWLAGELGGVRLLLLDAPALYDRAVLYTGGATLDEARRFTTFSRAVAARAAAEPPDVLVAHDWHAALSICALRTLFDFGPARSVGTVQVVHNNAYQGRFPAAAMAETGLPRELFHSDGLEFFGDLCLLKGGLAWAERIVAVSPRHAAELQTPAFGAGLEGLYRWRAHRLLGIANGIDAAAYDPALDPALPARYSASYAKPKGACRAALLARFGLTPPEPGRLLAAIGRLSEQKGWDVLAEAIPALVERGAALVLLGDGDAERAAQLRDAALRFPDRVAVAIGWDEVLARQLYAGADCVLVPSRFEPCGLVQLLAQRYGALPIAHRVGGLVDTIADGETGVLFEPLDVEALVAAVERAVALVHERGLDKLQRRLLALDGSWSRPAVEYESVLAAVAREGVGRL
jgi:starch synthase